MVVPRTAWLTLVVTSLVGFMVSLEITVISLARDEIARALPDASPSELSWVITAYNIGIASLLLPAGWAADRYGRRRLFLWGLGIFAVGSFASGLANSSEALIAFRILQSVGGALQFPTGLALLLTAFPLAKRQTAIGVWGAMGGLAAALGPSLGALLIDGFGWRAVFLINVPVAVGALLIGPRWLQESTGEHAPGRVDLLSVPLASLGVGSAILGIVQGSSWGWGSPSVVGSFVLAVLLIAIFVVRSSTHPVPLFDLALLRLPSYLIANLGSVLFVVAFFGWLITFPEFVQRTWGWSVLRTGFAIAPGPMLAAMISPVAGRLADRIGNAPILVVGGCSGALGALGHLVFTGAEPAYLTGVLLPGLLLGISGGCSFAMLVGASMRDIGPSRYGMAGAGRTTMFQLSIAVGVAVAISLVGSPADETAAVGALQRVWLLSAVLFAGQAALFAFVFPARPPVGAAS